MVVVGLGVAGPPPLGVLGVGTFTLTAGVDDEGTGEMGKVGKDKRLGGFGAGTKKIQKITS